MDVMDKLTILTDAAKYDAACTSSGAQRGHKAGHIGLHRGVLPHVFRGRAVRYAAEGADDQLLRL